MLITRTCCISMVVTSRHEGMTAADPLKYRQMSVHNRQTDACICGPATAKGVATATCKKPESGSFNINLKNYLYFQVLEQKLGFPTFFFICGGVPQKQHHPLQEVSSVTQFTHILYINRLSSTWENSINDQSVSVQSSLFLLNFPSTYAEEQRETHVYILFLL